MQNSRALKIILFISGLIGAGVGTAILFAPVAFFATNDIALGDNAGLLSEIRAPGGALLACGILILSGAFVTRLAYISAALSGLLYLSYGFSRILSIAIDGLPGNGLVAVTILEIIIGLVSVYALVQYRGNRQAFN